MKIHLEIFLGFDRVHEKKNIFLFLKREIDLKNFEIFLKMF
jgi:hypothetical protein